MELKCPKCGGRIRRERQGADVDYYCATCGWRYTAAQQVPAQPSAISANNVLRRNGIKVPEVSQTYGGLRLHSKECAYCGATFMGVFHQKYCNAECRSFARRLTVVRHCRTCGAQITGENLGPRLYCNDDCKKGKPGGYVGNCLNCGKAIYHRSKGTKYCNNKCSTEYRANGKSRENQPAVHHGH